MRVLGRVGYAETVQAMRAFTEARTGDTPDEIWLCEHAPVFTQGLAGRPDHVLDAEAVPVIATNRGGQVTYHGPGQVVAYPLVDLRRAGYFIKEYVYRVEEAVIREAATGLVQSRVSIDRFTGGARDGALFNQQPAFGSDRTRFLAVGDRQRECNRRPPLRARA